MLLKRLLQSNVAVAIVEASPGCLGEHRSGEAGSSCLVGPRESGIHTALVDESGVLGWNYV